MFDQPFRDEEKRSTAAGAFTKLYKDIENYAVLFRAGITVQTVRSARPKRWASFLASLKFQEPGMC